MIYELLKRYNLLDRNGCDFLLAFWSNYAHIFCRFWDTADSGRKSSIYPACIWRSRWGDRIGISSDGSVL